MPTCEVCGNEYDKAFDIVRDGESHTFDSFECAIHVLAPTCEHCGCRIIGHGVEAGGRMFCCVHCAEEAGVVGLADRGN
jgi:Rieske Fe-S protein